MFQQAGKLRVSVILLILALAVTVPYLASGYSDARRADASSQSGEYADAAGYYRAAALKLPWRPALWEQAALADVRAGNYAAAMSIYESLSRHGALSADHWEIYGALYASTGRPDDARRIWTAGLSAYPSHTHFYTLISAAYKDLGDYANQRVWLERWVATGNAGAPDRFELGLLLLTTDAEAARRELMKAATLDRAYDPAVMTLTSSIDLAQQQGDEAKGLVVLGRGLGLVNRWPLAEAAFQRALDRDRQNAQAWAWLGEARQHNAQDGGSELDRAAALDANDPLIHALIGLYWNRHGEHTRELAEYQNAARLEPENPEWHADMAGAYAATGDLVSALASYQKATELAPDNATYWRLLATFSADTAVQVQEVGLPAAKKAASLAPTDALALDALGWAYAQAGLLYNAERTLREAAKVQPDLALVHVHLAETYLRKGDQPSARMELQSASRLGADGPVGAFADKLLQQYFP